ncbi:MAG: hypothetical protein K0Q73_7242 [Paenibacillus sp.]|jgi:hypothetical protein|nr:hypothetical protein [Paenibacillus sp.]
MNCPACIAGVLEAVGYVELKTGTLQIQLTPFVPENTAALIIKICSKDLCGHVKLEAAPASLSLAKSTLRDALYAKRRKLP